MSIITNSALRAFLFLPCSTKELKTLGNINKNLKSMKEKDIKELNFTDAICKIQNSPHTLRRLKYTLHGISPENPTNQRHKIIYITTLLEKYETQKKEDADADANANANANANADADADADADANAKTKTQKVPLMPLKLPSHPKTSSPRTTEKYKMMQEKINDKSESNKDRFLDTDARLSRYIDTTPDKNHINGKADRACLISNMNVNGDDFGYACQYPKNEAIPSFYSFLYDENIKCVHVISTEEDKVNKELIRYFIPDNDIKMTREIEYEIKNAFLPEHMKITTKKIMHTKENTTYELKLTLNDVTHTIKLLHTFKWKDHAGVNTEVLDKIVGYRQRYDSNGKKTLTHCTAGVGRTGVVLAAHALSLNQELDPLSVVTNLRACRNNLMVQTSQQTDLLLNWDINHRIQQTPDKDIKPQKPLIVFKDPIYENVNLGNHTHQNYPYEYENQAYEDDQGNA